MKKTKTFIISSMEEMKEHYESAMNTYVFNQSVEFTIDIVDIPANIYVNGDLKAKQIDCDNLIVKKELIATNISCKKTLEAEYIKASSIKACRLKAFSVLAYNIIYAGYLNAIVIDATIVDCFDVIVKDTINCLLFSSVNFNVQVLNSKEVRCPLSSVNTYKDNTGNVKLVQSLYIHDFYLTSSFDCTNIKASRGNDIITVITDGKFIIATLKLADGKQFYEKIEDNFNTRKAIIDALLMKAELYSAESLK